MQIDPAQIQLSYAQQVYLARLAEQTGRPWTELLEEAVPADPSDDPLSASPDARTAIHELLKFRGSWKDGTVEELLEIIHEGRQH